MHRRQLTTISVNHNHACYMEVPRTYRYTRYIARSPDHSQSYTSPNQLLVGNKYCVMMGYKDVQQLGTRS